MIEVLQKVTTFPLELIDIPKMDDLYNKDYIHSYYSNLITTKKKDSDFGTVSEDELTEIATYMISKKNPSSTPLLLDDDKVKEIKKRFLTYNAIYDKLFANSLNVLEKTDEPTVIVFPIYDQSDKGRVEINPKATNYYYNKFEKIKKTIEFKGDENTCYIGLNVFTSEKKDEYKKYMKTQFEDIKKLIDEYNANAKQLQSKAQTPPKFIKNLLFIIDTDKKGLFTGFYKTQLSKEKQEILNKEYSSFLSSSGIRYRKIDDASITLTFNNVVNETKRFKQRSTVGIGNEFLSNGEFDEFITLLKELYKKITDKQYKDSLDLKDNIKNFKIFYKLENADKVLEDKIQTGSNKLYYIHKEDKNNVIGSFLLVSEERGIYRFKEDVSQYRIRFANTKTPDNTNTKANENQKEMEVDNEINSEKEKEEPRPKNAYDFAVQIKNKYGIFKYKNLDKSKTYDKDVLEGEIFPYLDKTEGSFEWFNHRDIDASLLNKEIIKYYSDILFDKKTLTEYLKSKNKYTDKTVLAYEFLKINDSQELSDYCDFIHNKFKSNIIDISPSGFDAFNPFKIKFDDNTIIKNIRDILFDTNTPIYLRKTKQTKDTQREASRDSYKIVTYKIFEDFEKDESCQPKEDSKDRTNKCRETWKKYTVDDKGKAISLIVIVTKENLKDVGLLKSKTDCKSKKNKIIYDYKKLFSNVTRRLGFGYLGGTKKITTKISGKFSGKRRLKAKRYK